MQTKLRIIESISVVLAIALIFLTAIMGITLVENFGSYLSNGTIVVIGNSLSGSYAQALLGLQSCVIIFTGLFVILHLVRARLETKEEFNRFEPLFGKQILWFSFEKWFMLTCLAVGIASAGLDIHLLQNFSNVQVLSDGTLGGPYATGVFSIAVISLVLSFFTMLLKSDEFQTFWYVVFSVLQMIK